MSKVVCPILFAIVVLGLYPVQAFAGASSRSLSSESTLTASSTNSSSFTNSSFDAGVNSGQQDRQAKRSMIKYGFDLVSSQPGRADATLISLRGGLTSVSRKAAAAGVELTVVW